MLAYWFPLFLAGLVAVAVVLDWLESRRGGDDDG